MVKSFSYRSSGRRYVSLAPGGVSRTVLALTFSALCDGIEFIHIKGDKIWIVHEKWDLPIDITIQGELFDDLTWSDGSNPGSTSDELTIPFGGNAGTETSVSLTKISGRGDVTIDQEPSEDNGYETIIKIDDDLPTGTDAYEFNLRFPDSDPVSPDPYIHVTTQTSLRGLNPVSYRHLGISYSSLPPSENLPIRIKWSLFAPFVTIYPEIFSTSNGWSFTNDSTPSKYVENFIFVSNWSLSEPFNFPIYTEDFSSNSGWSLYEPFLTVYEESFSSDTGWTLVSN